MEYKSNLIAACLIFFICCSGNTTHEPLAPAQKLAETADTVPVKPKFRPEYDKSLWTEVHDLDPDIALDIRYATANNFVNVPMYECGYCFLRPPVAKAIAAVQTELKKKGYRLKMYDCYRPRPVQQKLWDKVPDDRYVTPPWKGSMHNRGMAVDLTIVDASGKELDMGTPYDFFGEQAYHTYTNLPENVLKNRTLLRETMTRHGFRHIRTEWWHYSYTIGTYALSDWVWKCN